ncbi:MAG: hypothetical protein WAS27_01665 [Candidatus Saccharimonadales bacterium]
MPNLHLDIGYGLIRQDASFMVGLFLSLQKLKDKNNIPFLLSSIDFYSLIIYEASQFHIRNSPELSSQLQTEFSEIIKQSRQRMKLFDDKALGIEGIGSMFINTLTPQHQKELSKDHLIPLPKWMWTDIGVYIDKKSNIPVGTTHLASFNSGVTNPSDFFSPETSVGLGQHLGSFLKLYADTITFVRIKDVSVIAKDMRYNQIYSKKNYGSDNEQINAGLSVIDMRMNFLALLASRCSQSPTMFKWKFLSIYHAVSSLSKFSKTEHFTTLSNSQQQSITIVLSAPIAALMLSEEVTPLRNTLTHYGLDTRINSSELHDNRLRLFGLVEASLPDWDYERLYAFIDEQLQSSLLDMFEIWGKELTI